jgi:hypothetical protein
LGPFLYIEHSFYGCVKEQRSLTLFSRAPRRAFDPGSHFFHDAQRESPVKHDGIASLAA